METFTLLITNIIQSINKKVKFLSQVFDGVYVKWLDQKYLYFYYNSYLNTIALSLSSDIIYVADTFDEILYTLDTFDPQTIFGELVWVQRKNKIYLLLFNLVLIRSLDLIFWFPDILQGSEILLVIICIRQFLWPLLKVVSFLVIS